MQTQAFYQTWNYENSLDNETITVLEIDVLDYTHEHYYESVSYNSNPDSSPYKEPRFCFY